MQNTSARLFRIAAAVEVRLCGASDSGDCRGDSRKKIKCKETNVGTDFVLKPSKICGSSALQIGELCAQSSYRLLFRCGP